MAAAEYCRSSPDPCGLFNFLGFADLAIYQCSYAVAMEQERT
jgi:hypothetical protein